MRSAVSLVLPLLALSLSGCGDSTGPEIFSISGRWESTDFTDARFGMTIVETARAVEGACYRIGEDGTSACRVIGANAGRVTSLLLDFDDRPDISFEGQFESGEESTLITGALYGGGYSGDSITFQRNDGQSR